MRSVTHPLLWPVGCGIHCGGETATGALLVVALPSLGDHSACQVSVLDILLHCGAGQVSQQRARGERRRGQQRRQRVQLVSPAGVRATVRAHTGRAVSTCRVLGRAARAGACAHAMAHGGAPAAGRHRAAGGVTGRVGDGAPGVVQTRGADGGGTPGGVPVHRRAVSRGALGGHLPCILDGPSASGRARAAL
jgi:hypothetical protein